jgi:hypothetical protein
MTLHIDNEGRTTFIHRDDLQRAMAPAGRVRIKRASHVDPDDDGRWWADLAPMGGPKFGPFTTRAAALNAELAWLEERLQKGAI